MIRHKARKLARSHGCLRADEEDIAQELAVHALRRIGRHDRDRACEHTFANRILTNKVRDLLRRVRAQRRDAGRECSAQELGGRTLDEIHDHRSRGERHRDLRLDLAEALAALPAHDRDIALALTERPLTEVARVKGLSRQMVRSARDRIRRHLENCGVAA